ncbi:hypothetical protein ACQP1U_06770 [Actinomycetota bacterium]
MNETFNARDALATAADSRRHLADRLVTPIWYHPLVGVTLFMLCCAIGMPEGSLERKTRLYLIVGATLINTLLLPWLYRRRTGVTMQQATGARSRRFFLLGMIPFAAVFVAAGANHLLDGPTWVPLVLGAVAFIGSIVFGRSYDNALRTDLREDDA